VTFQSNISARRGRCFPSLVTGNPGTPAVLLLILLFSGASFPTDKNSDRPKLPYNMMGLRREDIDAYDSKAEPVANTTAALLALNKAGWDVIHKYFPALGTESEGIEKRTHAEDRMDSRFFANYANEDAAFSPMPLLCVIWSLPESELSGRLKALRDQLAPAMALEDYSTWKLDDLRNAVNSMTNPAKTVQGVKYRTPKSSMSFAQALRLYAMTIALVRVETKWADKADNPPPDMADFNNRLRQQLPRQVRDGETTAFFLYRPGVLSHPLSKEEFEERADVVVMSRKATTVEVKQFPVYLTEDQREWSPAWIAARDEQNDTTLVARKYDHDWTRLDGPYLWFRYDQLNGAVTYRATIELHPDEISIEAERSIESRGAVKRVQRPRDYDPAQMTAFRPGVDIPAGPPDAFAIDPPRVEDQANNLKRLGPYFSNGFRAWCAYGLSASGLAADGKTWVAVPPDEPRPAGSSPQTAVPQSATGSQAATQR
jgi:hypothetical protein